MQRLVYLTCELKSRDLESRLLIAGHLLDAGIAVIVGQQWAMMSNASTAPKGCHLVKTANQIMSRYIAKTKAAGHLVALADEEALPFVGAGFLSNIDPGAIANANVFLAASAEQASLLLARFPGTNIETVGSARIDLITAKRYERPIDEPYILFNTSLALTNSVHGSVETAIRIMAAGGIDPNTPEGAADLRFRLGFEQKSRPEIIELIRWAAETLPILTVVRPHPAEKTSAWESLLPSRARLVANQDPLPWLNGTELVVHCNSTTGLEAAILGRPCINLSPAEYDTWTDQFIMKRLNIIARSANEAKALIERFFQDGASLGPLSHLPEFPKNGTQGIANAINALLKKANATPLGGEIDWKQFARRDVQREKFTAPLSEIVEALRQLHPEIPCRAMELDDSVALLLPGH